MTKFKVGDRVAFYSSCERHTGTVVEIDTDGSLRIETATTVGKWLHPKQCRRIKPRAKLREFWVNIYPDGHSALHTTKESADESVGLERTECIHVRELRRKNEVTF